MDILKIRSRSKSKLDLIALGEILLRFDAGEERIHTARSFQVWDGGGEYNVAKNLSKVFGRRTSVATALTENALGRLALDFAAQGGVDTSHVIRREPGVEKTRNGLYFIERGFGLRNPTSCFDRDHTAVSQLEPGDFDWKKIFKKTKPRWLHTGGIFAGLSDSTFEVALEAVKEAKEHKVVVSYDLNYRDSLWKNRGGIERANELNKKLLKYADVVIGIPGFKTSFADLDILKFQEAADGLREEFPDLKLIVSTIREIKSANLHNFTAVCADGEQIHKAHDYLDIEVLDRVGSGDAFAAGLIYGLLEKGSVEYALECGTAHGALVMTTPGDNSMAKISEIEELMRGEGFRVDR